MNDEHDWDDQLVSRFAEDDVPDGGFSAAIVARLEWHRRRRRIVATGPAAGAWLDESAF